MKITNEARAALGGPWAQLGGDPSLGEGEVPIDCCNPGGDPPPDRAEDQDVLTVNAPATGGIVQQKVGAFHSPAGAFTLNFDATPTNGNTMVAFVFGTDGNAAEVTTSGWTKRQEGTANGDHVEIWTKVAGAAEPTGVALGVVSGSNTTHRLVLFEVAGSYDTSAQETAQPNTSPLTGPSITAAATGVLLSAFIGQVATYMGDPTWTPQGGLIEDSFLRQSPGRLVSWVGHEAVVAGAYAPQMATTALYSGRTTANAAVIIGATPTAVEWNVPAPNTVDDDDATYQEIEGEDVLQIDLGGPFRIVRSRLLVGADDAGTRTYQIGGANEADFSDLVTLGSISFAATGSFTPDDLDILWTTDQTYRYYQLTGSDENRRVFSWELYEPDTSQGQDHTHDAIEDAIAANSAALDAHVSEILTHQTAETDDTLVLAPDGAGGVEWVTPTGSGGEDVSFENVASSGTTETIDCQDARLFHVVLTDNCTITLTGPVSNETHRVTILLQQDAVGSRTVTWPGSVYWPGAAAPTLATTAHYTDWVDLVTFDGGAHWLGVLNAAAYHTPAISVGGGTFPILPFSQNL